MDRLLDSFVGFMTVFVGAIIVLLAVLMVGIRYPVHHYDQIKCAVYATETGRPTKFVDYNFWDWGCLTPAANGKWISIDALYDEVDR